MDEILKKDTDMKINSSEATLKIAGSFEENKFGKTWQEMKNKKW